MAPCVPRPPWCHLPRVPAYTLSEKSLICAQASVMRNFNWKSGECGEWCEWWMRSESCVYDGERRFHLFVELRSINQTWLFIVSLVSYCKSLRLSLKQAASKKWKPLVPRTFPMRTEMIRSIDWYYFGTIWWQSELRTKTGHETQASQRLQQTENQLNEHHWFLSVVTPWCVFISKIGLTWFNQKCGEPILWQYMAMFIKIPAFSWIKWIKRVIIP